MHSSKSSQHGFRMDTPSPAQDFYESGYHSRRHARLMEDERYFLARAAAAAHLYFPGSLSSLRIFEFGCGIGQNIAALPEAAGWDVSAEARESCKRRGLKVFDRLEDAPQGAWDIVFCRHALEHIEHPLDALRLMRPLLKPGGELYLIVPKEGHRQSSLKPDLNQHLYCWNFRALNNLLIRAGYRPFSNRYLHSWGYGYLLPLRRLLGQRAYELAARAAGWICRNGEIVVRSKCG